MEKDLEELKIRSIQAISLMKKKDYEKVLKKNHELDSLKIDYKIEYIFIVRLEFLIVRYYRVNGDIEDWFTFKDLKQTMLTKRLTKRSS